MRKFTYLLLILMVLALMSTGCGSQGATTGNGEQSGKQEVIILKMADSVPVSHLNATVVAKNFIDRVTELTNGRVKIEYFPAEQLGKQKDLLNLNSQGITDIARKLPCWHPHICLANCL